MANQVKQPTSKFEKFLLGLKVIVQAQPGASMDFTVDGKFLVGHATDPFLSEGMKQYLLGLGFSIDDKKEMFAFLVKNE